MPLTNKQYDAIMREYDRRQYQNYREQLSRQDEVYRRIPLVEAVDSEISSLGVSQIERIIDGEPGAREELRGKLAALRRKKEPPVPGGSPPR